MHVYIYTSTLTQEFEKDDLSLGHVDFVAAAAHLRCQVYSLRSVSTLEVRKVAGRIVPAVATTTYDNQQSEIEPSLCSFKNRMKISYTEN